MSLLWLWLKAQRLVETDYDYAIGLILVDLDLIVLAEWYRILLHKQGR